MGDIVRKRKGGKDYGWYIRWTEGGRRREKASHQPTYALARRMLLAIEARVARGEAGIVELSSSALTVAALCEKFLTEFVNPRIKDLRKWRVKNQLALRRLLSHIGKISAVALDEQQVARARDKSAQNYAPGSVRNALSALHCVFSWAMKRQLVAKNPVLDVPRPPSPPPRLDFWTGDEVRALLAETERRARHETGIAALAWQSKLVAISLAVRLGLRKGECFGLRWRDIDIDGQRLTVARSYATTPKSGKARHLRLPSALLPLLRAWRERCPATTTANSADLVCPVRLRGSFVMASHTGSDHGLPQLLRSAGCRVFSRPWHMLRHSFASHFVQSGGSLLALSQILGHSDARVTLGYAHLSSDFLAAELDKVKF